VPGKHDWALEFDGNDYVSVAAGDSLDATAITVVVWARVDVAAATRILVNRHWNNNDEGWLLYAEGNSFKFGHSDTPGPGRAEAVSSDITYTPGIWYHVAGLYDGTDHAIYVNGIEKKENATYGIRNSGEPILLGATRLPHGLRGFHLQGMIEDVLLYNRALSVEEIAWLYREPYAFYK